MANVSPHASHPVFDLEDQIVKAGNQPCPVDLKPWQGRVDQLAGKTLNGLPRLRITWGQDWNHGSMIVMSRPRLKYCFWRYEEAGQIHDIGVPRFYLEELQPKARLVKSGWDNARFHIDEDTGEIQDVIGPIPEDGFYTCVFVICLHDDVCCSGTGMQKVRDEHGKWTYEQCLGAYRPPCDADLQRIRRIIWNRDHASNDEIATSDSLIEKHTDELRDRRDERWATQSREYMDDFTRSHAWKWTEDDPTKLNWGKWHFMQAHNKSGTPEPAQSPGGFTVIDRRRIEREESDVSSGDAANRSAA